ncbi:MAG TPA: Rpn family recombination-promoting nuclease/putative transposase, partial [Thermoanaerobaculia bacterium]
MAEHDGGYRLLFSHPEMVADLLRDLIPEDWVRDIDLSTLEQVPGDYVTPGLSSRESDLVWRVRWGEDNLLYIYLLFEFQSTVDPWMALRMTVYVGLLYQELLKRREIPRSGKLPPVLPLVLYNGNAPWGAAREVSELIGEIPGDLELYRPRLRYCLLDAVRMADSELESLRNVAAALFRLEKSRGPEDIQRVVTALLEWLRGPEMAELRRSFASYLLKNLLPARMPGVEIPEIAELEEVKSMLAERVTEWTQQWKQEGLEEGL